MPALLDAVGGPAPGRERALRRILKTLVTDVYVVDRGGSVGGVIALAYRRSLRHGGLTATIDTLRANGAGETHDDDLALLVECALQRARRRGCVAIDACIETPEVRGALEAQGFVAGSGQLSLALRDAPGEERE